MTRARRAWWIAGAPFRAVLIGAIRVYRVTLSGWLGGQCRFYPTCSHYGEEAIRTHGALKGSVMATWRVLRCNPFGAGGVERVPPPRVYETDIRNRAGAQR
jgi:putative membrane protein insertion efficiency factor